MSLVSINSDGTSTLSGVLSPPPASSSVVAGVTNALGMLQYESTTTGGFTNSGSGTAILCARGTTVITQLGEGSQQQPGYYAIEEWTRFNTSSSVPGTGITLNQTPVLFTGVQIGQHDITSRVLCMNNVKVLYSFGQNYGDVAITGEILLGNYGDKFNSEQMVSKFVDFFWKNRVSNLLYPVTVSAVKEKYLVYLEGMDFGAIDPQFHILPFVLHGTLIDIARDAAVSANASGLVLTSSDLSDSSIAAGLAATTVFDSSTTGATASGASTSASDPSLNPQLGPYLTADQAASYKPAFGVAAPALPVSTSGVTNGPTTITPATLSAQLSQTGINTPEEQSYSDAADNLASASNNVTTAQANLANGTGTQQQVTAAMANADVAQQRADGAATIVQQDRNQQALLPSANTINDFTNLP